MIDLNKAKGSIFGLFSGDTLGGPLEFQNIDGIDPIKKYISGGVHSLKEGQFTDDSSMAIALMHSLTEKGFDQKDQMDKYLSWMMKGEYSSKGFCFDIGIATQRALNNYKITGNVISGLKENHSSGNGSLMRLAPILVYFYNNGVKDMIHYARESSVVTHGSDIVLDSLTYFSVVFEKIMSGEKNKDIILEIDPVKFNIVNDIVLEDLLSIDIKTYDRYDLKPTGYIVDTMICALWCFYHTNSFEEAIIKAVNLGGISSPDSDTVGAITGQLAGAYYGFDSIPEHFVKGLVCQDMINGYTNAFLESL